MTAVLRVVEELVRQLHRVCRVAALRLQPERRRQPAPGERRGSPGPARRRARGVGDAVVEEGLEPLPAAYDVIVVLLAPRP